MSSRKLKSPKFVCNVLNEFRQSSVDTVDPKVGARRVVSPRVGGNDVFFDDVRHLFRRRRQAQQADAADGRRRRVVDDAAAEVEDSSRRHHVGPELQVDYEALPSLLGLFAQRLDRVIPDCHGVGHLKEKSPLSTHLEEAA